MKRQLGWGLIAAVLGALVVPIADGALAVATPTAITAPPAATVDFQKPPPPTSKSDPADRTPGVKSPTPVTEVTGGTTSRALLDAAAESGECADPISGTTGGAPSVVSSKGVQGTTTADIASFATAYNAKRVANCLKPVPLANFRYDSCMERRLFWIAEDPSTDPSSAWGHIGTQRSDGVPSVGCDGNLAGGMNNTGTTVAIKWWDSTAHRTSLYKPSYDGSTASVCIYVAMTHGGVPNEPVAFTRAAARWSSC